MMHRVIGGFSLSLCAAPLLPATALAQQSGPYPTGITAAPGDAYPACKAADSPATIYRPRDGNVSGPVFV